MEFSLKESDQANSPYSKMERRVFAALSIQRRDSKTITKMVYGSRRKPEFARGVVIGTLRGLSKRISRNKEPFAIKESPARGPHPKEFWLEVK